MQEALSLEFLVQESDFEVQEGGDAGASKGGISRSSLTTMKKGSVRMGGEKLQGNRVSLCLGPAIAFDACGSENTDKPQEYLA